MLIWIWKTDCVCESPLSSSGGGGGLSAEQQPANGNIRSQPNSQILHQISLVHMKTYFVINIVMTIIAR